MHVEDPTADWGSAPCDIGRAPVTAEDPVLSSLAAQATVIIETAAVPIAFSDGTSTVAHISFPQVPQPCRTVDGQLHMRIENRLLPAVPESGLQLVGPVAVVTDDRRWVASLPASAGGAVASGALTTLGLHTDAKIMSATDFAAYYGFSGVDYGTFDKAWLTFTVDYTVDGTQRAKGGHFDITAFTVRDAGSSGSTTLLTGSVGGP